MGNAVSILRNFSFSNIYIANGYVAAYMSYEGRPMWQRICRCFQNENAVHKRDGIYILPSFYGSDSCGHWYLNVVEIHNRSPIGYTLDSLGTSYGE